MVNKPIQQCSSLPTSVIGNPYFKYLSSCIEYAGMTSKKTAPLSLFVHQNKNVTQLGHDKKKFNSPSSDWELG